MEPGNQLLGFLAALADQEKIKVKTDFESAVVERMNQRINSIQERLEKTTSGRATPELEQVAINTGRQFSLSILFLDIVGFSSWPNSNHDDQKNTLAIFDLFMSEAMNLIRDLGGTFEKNTGDGLMAYFGSDVNDPGKAVHDSVLAAQRIHYFNNKHISPWLQRNFLRPINFKVGIDFGPVTVAKLGLKNTNSFVAIGTTANIACHLMDLIPSGGICIGQAVYELLPQHFKVRCTQINEYSGYVYINSKLPYPAWSMQPCLISE